MRDVLKHGLMIKKRRMDVDCELGDDLEERNNDTRTKKSSR